MGVDREPRMEATEAPGPTRNSLPWRKGSCCGSELLLSSVRLEGVEHERDALAGNEEVQQIIRELRQTFDAGIVQVVLVNKLLADDQATVCVTERDQENIVLAHGIGEES